MRNIKQTMKDLQMFLVSCARIREIQVAIICQKSVEIPLCKFSSNAVRI